MTEWEPATETEAAMRDALRAGDQELYFRILARTDLLLPVSAEALAGRAPMGWGTWTTGGRTHVLAFTSTAALRACLAENAGSTRRSAYSELATGWPNPEWWLAVNPGLPIEGYLPAWFVSQLSRGDVRLPGRSMGARARLEQVERAARARATAAVPRRPPDGPPRAEPEVAGPFRVVEPDGPPFRPTDPARNPVEVFQPVDSAAGYPSPFSERPRETVEMARGIIELPGETVDLSREAVRLSQPIEGSVGPAPAAPPSSDPAPFRPSPAPSPVPPSGTQPTPATVPVIAPTSAGSGSGGDFGSQISADTSAGWMTPASAIRPTSSGAANGSSAGSDAPVGSGAPSGSGAPVGPASPVSGSAAGGAPGTAQPESAPGAVSPSGVPVGQSPGNASDAPSPVAPSSVAPSSVAAPGNGSVGPSPLVAPGNRSPGSTSVEAPPAWNRPTDPEADRVIGPVQGQTLEERPVVGQASPSGLPAPEAWTPPPPPVERSEPSLFTPTARRPADEPGSADFGSAAVESADFGSAHFESADFGSARLGPVAAGPAEAGPTEPIPTEPIPAGPDLGHAGPDLGHAGPDLGRSFPGGSAGPESSAADSPPIERLDAARAAPSRRFGSGPSVSERFSAGRSARGQAPTGPSSAAGPSSSTGPSLSGSFAADPGATQRFTLGPEVTERFTADPSSGGEFAASPQVTQQFDSGARFADRFGSGPSLAGQVSQAAGPAEVVPAGPADNRSPDAGRDTAPSVGTEPRHPVGAQSRHPLGTESPQPVGTEPPQPVGTEPPQPVGTEPPQPVGTEPPQPVGTEPPQPVGTESPRPVGTEPPSTGAESPLAVGTESARLGSAGPGAAESVQRQAGTDPFPARRLPSDFTPANEVERSLLDAAGDGSTDTFLSTLLLARVLLPVAYNSASGSRPGEEGFEWRTELLDGERYVVVFTSPERLGDHLPETIDTIEVKFAQLIRRWPDENYSFAVNPGTPVGAKLPGGQIVALANWAAEVGLGDDTGEPAAQDQAEEEAPRSTYAPDREDPGRPTMMQKTIAPSQLSYYLDRGYDRVSGFVHRASEVAHLRTPAKLYAALGLNHPGSPFERDAGEIYVLRWPAYRPSLYRIPYGGQNEAAMRAMEGWVIERPPFRGNGFAPGESSDVVAEFKVDSVRLPHGAQLHRIGADGSERLMATLDCDVPVWRRAEED
ncbi:SseB family protein [Plantactinospora sp. WMMB782]|uniref:SseB family protein n=1 Tax=Plantactinospora sp. WMMB782 TaxID=3404121 RepID=UPI003B93FD7A